MTKKRKAKRKPPKRSKQREKFIGFHTDIEVSQRLNLLAKAEDRPVASVLRKAVNDYLDTYELLVSKEQAKLDKPEEERNQRKRKSR